MDGYEVKTSDDATAGRVVGERGDALVVETGTVFKHRHVLPRVFVAVDEAEGVVRSTLSKQMIEDSPRMEDGEVDDDAVMQHYGLVGTEVAPPTQGYGEVNADDPAWTADQQALRDGLEPAEQQRARIRSDLGHAYDDDGGTDPVISPGRERGTS
jgi:hypothetical protein